MNTMNTMDKTYIKILFKTNKTTVTITNMVITQSQETEDTENSMLYCSFNNMSNTAWHMQLKELIIHVKPALQRYTGRVKVRIDLNSLSATWWVD